MNEKCVVGSILGTAVGDAIGLPYEGLPRRRAARLLGVPNRHRLCFGFGMTSDDTEHTCIVAQSLIAAGGDIERFEKQLAMRLRFWLLSLPAGIGLATLRSLLRLWMGCSPQESGVFSAGNGPAVRSAILGVAIRDRNQLRDFVRVCTRITHRDPKADYGAFAIALAAQIASSHRTISGDYFLDQLEIYLGQEASELIALISMAVESAKLKQPALLFATQLGLARGVSGYVYHSVPIAIQAWLSHPHDFKTAIISAVECGGDTDSIAAMVGGIAGAAVGKDEIPQAWCDRILTWDRSTTWMERLGIQLHSAIESGRKKRPMQLSRWKVASRSLFFGLIILGHGLRRLLPPY